MEIFSAYGLDTIRKSKTWREPERVKEKKKQPRCVVGIFLPS